MLYFNRDFTCCYGSSRCTRYNFYCTFICLFASYFNNIIAILPHFRQSYDRSPIKTESSPEIYVHLGYGLFLSFYHWGGMVGGLRFMEIFGACSFGSGPVGGTSVGCSGSFILGGWIGTLLGLAIDVALPGLFVVSTSVRLWVWEGGAYAVRETIFYPRTINNPRVLLICLDTPVFLDFTILYSSASARTMFICLSKARKVPTIIRPSCRVSLTLKSIHCRNLLLWVAIFIIYNRLAGL